MMDETGDARVVAARGGMRIPRLGMGTWYMGEDGARRGQELAAIGLGLDSGMTLIDTAEMYGSGASEELVGEAIRGRREEVFVVSKVLPHNASRAGTALAAERSLARLGTDRIDLYLLHWHGPHPLEDTLAAFEALVAAGKILHYGVSNFDADDMATVEALAGGAAVAADQVMYNLARRGVERRLLPWCRDRDVALMVYSPLDHGRLVVRPALGEVAARHGVTPECAAIAWGMRETVAVSIPKAASAEHVRANAAALDLVLDADDLAALDAAYPAPKRDVPLDML